MTPGRQRSPFADPQAATTAGVMGMRIFLLSLGILFAVTLIGYLSIRILAIGRTTDLPHLPRALWLSTLLLVTSSGTMQWAVRSAQRGRQGALRAAMLLTLGLAVGFLAVQATCWVQWAGPMRGALAGTARVFMLTAFYVLTGLHALHVAGGLVPMIVVTGRSLAGRYGEGRYAGVIYTAMYWHFLDVVWLVLFATLMIGT